MRPKEIWGYRELLWFLARRDVAVLYKQTALGMTWAVIQPLFYMVLFSLFFGRIARLPSDGVPYPVFTYAALLPWHYFSTALSNSSQSLVAGQQLLTKVYFPRLIIPLAAVLPPLVDFAISLLILSGLMVYYGIVPTAGMLWLPAFLLLALVTALGAGLWLSALNIQYRDVRLAVPFLTQFWMWASPVAYGSIILPAEWRPFFGLNPMFGVIEGFRWGILGTSAPPATTLLLSFVTCITLLVSGTLFFQRLEKTFADVV